MKWNKLAGGGGYNRLNFNLRDLIFKDGCP